MNRLISICTLILFFQVTFVSLALSENMRAISFLPKNHPLTSQANIWVKTINSRLNGKVKIDYVGGAEVIPRYQQAEAVRNGVVDIIFNVASTYQAIIPEASAFTLSKLTPSEERESGFYNYMVKKHVEKLNSRYIGRWQMGNFYFWTKKEVTSVGGLKGLKLRTGSLFNRTMKAVNVVPVKIKGSETYTALERGVVDGFAYPVIGPRKKGWLKKVKFIIDAPLFGASNATILMNYDKWKKLSKATQDKVISITQAFEPKMVKHFTNGEVNELKEILSNKNVIKARFSEDQRQKFIKIAYGVEWNHLATKIPNAILELKRLTGN